jgi:hypothetical protein
MDMVGSFLALNWYCVNVELECVVVVTQLCAIAQGLVGKILLTSTPLLAMPLTKSLVCARSMIFLNLADEGELK